MTNWISLLQKYQAIAVIRYPKLEIGLNMAQAVAAGGIILIEITWNSDQPELLVSKLRHSLPECIIGAGTILTLPQLNQAIAAGAQFIFSPHLDTTLIRAAIAAEIPIIPGALTPTEIVTAWHSGASCVKVFPIQGMGGVTYLKSLQSPLGQIPLIPTGGVTIENALDFIQAGAVAVGLSGNLFPSQLVANHDWQEITARAKLLSQSISHHQYSHSHNDELIF